jgi:DNA repair protein RadC
MSTLGILLAPTANTQGENPMPRKTKTNLTLLPPASPPDNLADRLSYRIPKIRLCLVSETLSEQKRVRIQSPHDAVKFLDPLRHEPEEKFLSLHLNAKNEVIGLHEVSHGTLSSSLVHPREVFKAALLANSYAIIVCHNHPSGSALVPSKEDLQTTEQLLKAAQIIGVSLIDHLIVSPTGPPGEAYSIRENHPTLWN